MRYKTKPVEIEAIEWLGIEIATEILDWGEGKINIETNPVRMTIQTLEGVMTASKGDFIIKGLKGEFYPCKPDVFHLKYEEII